MRSSFSFSFSANETTTTRQRIASRSSSRLRSNFQFRHHSNLGLRGRLVSDDILVYSSRIDWTDVHVTDIDNDLCTRSKSFAKRESLLHSTDRSLPMLTRISFRSRPKSTTSNRLHSLSGRGTLDLLVDSLGATTRLATDLFDVHLRTNRSGR